MTLNKNIAIVGLMLGLLGGALAPAASAQSGSGLSLQSTAGTKAAAPAATKPAANAKAANSSPAPAAQPAAQPAAATASAPSVKLPTVQPGVVASDAVKKLLDQFKITLNDPKQPPKPEDLQKAYLVVWVTISNGYHDPSKLQNWGRWQHHFDGKLNTTADLEKALTVMLASLHDASTQYVSAADVAASTTLPAAPAAVASANQPAVTASAKQPATATAKPAVVSAKTAAANAAAATPAPAPQPAADSGLSPLGMTLAKQLNGTYKIDYLSYGSPAYTSDLRTGDPVTSIGGKVLNGMTPQDVQALTLVKTGDKVEIAFKHDGKDDKLTLTSAAPPAPKVSAQLLKNQVLIIRLPDFSDEQLETFENTLVQAEQQTQDKLPGMILDLRGNPGGSLDNAVGVAGLFIADGPLVSVTTREGRLVKPLEYDIIPPFPDRFAGNPELAHIIANLYGVPLVVLTDNSTGGTAEILAGALKDNKRAVIVGTTTYGKNVSLSREELATGGVLTITTSDYITPSGFNLSTNGLKPNKEVVHARAAKVDEPMVAATTELVGQMAAAKRGGKTSSGDSDDNSGSGISNKVLSAFSVAMLLLGMFLWAMYERQRKQREAQRKAAELNKKSGR